MPGSKKTTEADPVALLLQKLQEDHGHDAVEAARIMLGIPKNELEKKDDFSNKYEEKFADPNPIRVDYVPEIVSPRLKQKKAEMWQYKRVLHVKQIQKFLVGHCTAPFTRLKESAVPKILTAYQEYKSQSESPRRAACRSVSVSEQKSSKPNLPVDGQEASGSAVPPLDRKAAAMEKYLAQKEAARTAAEEKLQIAKVKFEADRKAKKIEQIARTKAQQEKTARCLQQAAAAHKSHMDHAYENAEALKKRLDIAQKYRDSILDPSVRQAAAAKSAEKTQARLMVALKQQQGISGDLQHRQSEAQARLNANNAARQASLDERTERSQAKNAKIKVQAQETLAKQAEDRVTRHNKFQDHFDEVNKTRRNFYHERSKSLNEKATKAFTTAQGNKKNNEQGRTDQENKYYDHMRKMEDRCNYVKSLKMKCGQDIYTHSELKDETFGDLQKRNYQTLMRSREMKNQVCFLKLREMEQKQFQKTGGLE